MSSSQGISSAVGGVSLRKGRVHSCANCIMWSLPPGREVGVCEIGDMQPLQGFDGNGVMKDDNCFWTTPDTYCDHQVPIPPPGPPCPKCGQPTVEGYGLMGGGCGAYAFCEAPGCDYFEKWQDPEMQDTSDGQVSPGMPKTAQQGADQ